MPNADDILAAVQSALDEIQAELGPAQWAAFEETRALLVKANMAASTPQEEAGVSQQVTVWLDKYPTVKEALLRKQPALFRAQAAGSAGSNPPVAGSAPRRSAAGSASAGQPAPALDPPNSDPFQPIPKDAKPLQPNGWTPETVMQLFKEVVTALIGLTLVVAMFWQIVHMVGLEHSLVEDARAVLDVIVGLVGVVLGYYFGRMPSEARADQAQKQTALATEHAERVRAKGEELGEIVEHAVGATVRGGAPSDSVELVRRKLSELRAATR